jgi:hypothetical protein
MGVDLGGLDILVTEEFLHSSNVIAPFQQVRSEAVPKDVRCDMFGDGRLDRCPTNSLLKPAFIQVMPTYNFGAGIYGGLFGRKDILPVSLTFGVGVFAGQRKG